MNVSDGSDLTTKDFYGGLTSNHWPKIVCMALSCAAMLTAVALCYAVIWFERFGSDAKRTIVNKIFSSTWNQLDESVSAVAY
jgi:hypothetical protein